MALMNILAMSGAFPTMTISIQDCTKHMAEGGKKDALYIADLFNEKVMEYNPLKTCIHVSYFDGASNVQKAGEVLMGRFPCSFCYHGGKHVVSLVFSSITKIKLVTICHVFAFWAIYNQFTHHYLNLQLLILKTCRLYNIFGLGANHGIYVQFMAQSAMANKGCTVNLLRGAGT
jgi:hypothetical protein